MQNCGCRLHYRLEAGQHNKSKILIEIPIWTTAIFKLQGGAVFVLRVKIPFSFKYCGAAELSWPTHHILHFFKSLNYWDLKEDLSSLQPLRDPTVKVVGIMKGENLPFCRKKGGRVVMS